MPEKIKSSMEKIINNNNSLSIILPLYNEEQNIKNLVNKITVNVKDYTDNFEIILVNDGSTDKTPDIINDIASRYPKLRIINHLKNKGYGAAVRTGIDNAKKKWLLIMDADGQFEINNLKASWIKKSSYDFILGYREKRNDNLYRCLLGKMGNFIANLFLKTDTFIKDINCGFKLFRTKQLQPISLVSEGGIISFEILHKLLINSNPPFVQLPIRHYKRVHSKSTGGKFKTIIKIILEGIKTITS